ncbi:hypothetical protein HYX08_03400 [Candidatus Woesearchaeota archaeon]|nr:hypothetical protein [Candidatus Woesearchaeota archaeon]
MRFNKKASLEISIQAIVIVVLAMTLLGLGLGFIRGMFKNIGSTTEDVTEQVRQRILDDLITGDKKISFPKTDITIDKGGSSVLTVGIRNKKDTPLHYKMRFNPISGPDGAPFSIDNPSWFQFAESQVYTLSAADSETRNIRLSIPTRVASGSYFLTFDVTDDDLPPPNNVYAQKDFFIVVRG